MALLDVEVRFPKGFKYADFDVKTLKSGLRKEGREIARVAKNLVRQKGVSKPDEYPGRDTGVLQKSIKPKPSRPGFSVVIKPWKTDQMGKDFYPAYVYYGHRGPRTRTAADNRRRKKTAGKKVAQPRKNFMVDATKMVGEDRIESNLAHLMDKALAAKEITFK
nr:MAG TPA: Putative head tail adaptor [Caudoviricetes sp.]